VLLLPYATPSNPNGAFTLKVAEAELEFASVMMTVLAPAIDDGTVNVAPENEPVASVLVVPLSVIGNPRECCRYSF
jgi:hypothetical protein